jgi:hypothetical protein
MGSESAGMSRGYDSTSSHSLEPYSPKKTWTSWLAPPGLCGLGACGLGAYIAGSGWPLSSVAGSQHQGRQG